MNKFSPTTFIILHQYFKDTYVHLYSYIYIELIVRSALYSLLTILTSNCCSSNWPFFAINGFFCLKLCTFKNDFRNF